MKNAVLLLGVIGVFLAGWTRAQEVQEGVHGFENVIDAMGAKFGRGVVNSLTGLGEFQRQFARTPETEVGWVRWPVAFGKGALMAAVRTGVGAVEVFGFFVPTRVQKPRRGSKVYDYGPILFPSYVWSNDQPPSTYRKARAGLGTAAPAPAAPAGSTVEGDSAMP